jgi:hypothetical protein
VLGSQQPVSESTGTESSFSRYLTVTIHYVSSLLDTYRMYLERGDEDWIGFIGLPNGTVESFASAICLVRCHSHRIDLAEQWHRWQPIAPGSRWVPAGGYLPMAAQSELHHHAIVVH